MKEVNYPFKILSALAYNPLMCWPVTLDLMSYEYTRKMKITSCHHAIGVPIMLGSCRHANKHLWLKENDSQIQCQSRHQQQDCNVRAQKFWSDRGGVNEEHRHPIFVRLAGAKLNCRRQLGKASRRVNPAINKTTATCWFRMS